MAIHIAGTSSSSTIHHHSNHHRPTVETYHDGTTNDKQQPPFRKRFVFVITFIVFLIASTALAEIPVLVEQAKLIMDSQNMNETSILQSIVSSLRSLPESTNMTNDDSTTDKMNETSTKVVIPTDFLVNETWQEEETSGQHNFTSHPTTTTTTTNNTTNDYERPPIGGATIPSKGLSDITDEIQRNATSDLTIVINTTTPGEQPLVTISPKELLAEFSNDTEDSYQNNVTASDSLTTSLNNTTNDTLSSEELAVKETQDFHLPTTLNGTESVSSSSNTANDDDQRQRQKQTARPLERGEWREAHIKYYEITPEMQSRFDTTLHGRVHGGGATTCTWHRNDTDAVSDECRKMLDPITQNIRRWYFLGDSTMARPFRYCLVPLFEETISAPTPDIETC